jgi:hypothetical protein
MTPSIPPLRPLSPTERKIATLLAQPDAPPNKVLALSIGWKPKSVAIAIERLAQKLPGTLPPRIRVTLWARGADSVVLHGCLAVTVAEKPVDAPAPPRLSITVQRPHTFLVHDD